MADPFMPAHEPTDDDQAQRDTTIGDDEVIAEPDAAPADTTETSAFRTPVAGDRLTTDELAKELAEDEPAN